MQQQVTRPRKPAGTADTSAGRALLAGQRLAALVDRLRTNEFESVHPARWRHLATGHHVETGYSYGEGRVRVYLGGGRTADAEFVISGRPDDLSGFHELLAAPVS